MIIKKTIVITIIFFLISLSMISSTGNFVTQKNLTDVNKTCYEDNIDLIGNFNYALKTSLYGAYCNPLNNIVLLAEPTINFPYDGEVFRTGDVIEINGTSSVADFENYILEWGMGQDPTDWYTNGITLIDNGETEIINGILGFWDTGVVSESGYYSIRLTVFLVGPGQYIYNNSVFLDSTLHENFPFGWPHEITGTQVAIWSPIALSDINNDGYPEIGFGTVSIGPVGDNNKDYVIDHMGNVLSGWPKGMYSIQGSSLTFADIDSSTDNLEVIGGMWGNQVFVWYDNGTNVDGWPLSILSSRASATVNDVDLDGDLEIILPSTDGGYIYVWNQDGTLVDGWPVSVGSPVRRAASTADIDDDGYPEIIFGDQNGYLYVLNHDGTTADGWPQLTHDWIKDSPVIADIEGDGDLEIIVSAGFTQTKMIFVYHHDGTSVDGWPKENGLSFVQPSVADIDNDGNLEILSGGAFAGTTYGRFFVWHHDGSLVSGFPIELPYDPNGYFEFIYAQPVVGDIDGDSDVEIIAGSYNNKLYAWHHDATDVAGWPKIIGDSVDSTAAIGDIDNDNLVEVCVAGDDGKIYVWDMDGIYNSSNIQWPMFQFDPHHTGCYGGSTGENLPPEIPDVDGPSSGTAGELYDYSFVSIDPDDDEIAYVVDWGDDSSVEIFGPAESGVEVFASHTWAEKGTYLIKVKARDGFGLESDWAILEVEMPFIHIKSFNIFNLIFKIFPNAFQILQFLLTK